MHLDHVRHTAGFGSRPQGLKRLRIAEVGRANQESQHSGCMLLLLLSPGLPGIGDLLLTSKLVGDLSITVLLESLLRISSVVYVEYLLYFFFPNGQSRGNPNNNFSY